jgi:hypothetical protein
MDWAASTWLAAPLQMKRWWEISNFGEVASAANAVWGTQMGACGVLGKAKPCWRMLQIYL